MAHDVQQDYLAVSARLDVPDESQMRAAITGAGLGAASFVSGGGRPAVGLVTRRRVGAFQVTGSRLPVTAEIVMYRYDDAMTHGMGEQTFLRLTQGLAPAEVLIMREGSLVYDIGVTTSDAVAMQGVLWAFHLARVVAQVCDGIVLDPGAQRCLAPRAMMSMAVERPETHITLHDEVWAADRRWLHTHGVQKYGQPEIDLRDVPTPLAREAREVLRQVVSSLTQGFTLRTGQQVLIEGTTPLIAITAPTDMDHQAGTGRLTLVDAPTPSEMDPQSPRECLATLALGEARQMLSQGNITTALATIERVLTALPDDSAALSLKATLAMRAGNYLEALAQGELMKMRSPGDYRGPLACATALAAMSRFPEALGEINQALHLEPEAQECFALRAEIYARMGDSRQAAEDRSHAVYLRHYAAR
jgi:hypothetical protein